MINPQNITDAAAAAAFMALVLYGAKRLRPWNRGLNPPEALCFVALALVVTAFFPGVTSMIARGFDVWFDWGCRALGMAS